MKAPMRSSGPRARPPVTSVEPVAEPRRVVAGRGGEHGVLAREVAVQGAPRHSGRLGDLLHAEPSHASPADEAAARRSGCAPRSCRLRTDTPARSAPRPALPGLIESRGHCEHILDTFCPFCLTLRRSSASGAACSRLRRYSGTDLEPVHPLTTRRQAGGSSGAWSGPGGGSCAQPRVRARRYRARPPPAPQDRHDEQREESDKADQGWPAGPGRLCTRHRRR